MKLYDWMLCSSALGIAGLSATAGAQSTSAGAADAGVLEEVLITAEYRESNLQKTAQNISVITADDLARQGIGDSKELLDAVPGLDMTFTNPNAYLGLYGVQSGGGSQYVDAQMTFNYGGVPLARQTAAASSMYDLERVEVLKGPQGTLYGRNATVGAVNVVVARPKIGEFSGNGSVTIGNYATVNTSGAANLPINDAWAARVAFQTTRHDGYFTNGYDDANNLGVRGSLLFKPSEDFSALVWMDGFRNRSKGPGTTFRYYYNNTQEWINPSNPWFGLGSAGSCSNQLLCPSYASTGATPIPGVNAQTPTTGTGFADEGPNGLGRFSVFGDDAYSNIDQILTAAQVDWRMAIGRFTAIAANVNTKIDFNSYSQGLHFLNQTEANQKSIELRLTSEDMTRLRWTGGLFYFKEKQDARQDNLQATGWAILRTPNLTDENYAAFADLTFSLIDSLRLTGGARYTHEEKNQDGFTTAPGLTAPNAALIASAGGTCFVGTVAAPIVYLDRYMPSTFCVIPNGGHDVENNVSWKAGIEADLTAESMLYLTVKNGFRAGGFTVGTQNVYKPEKLMAYELGSKNRFFDRKLQMNLSVFYWDYKDEQLSALRAYYVNGINVGQTSWPYNVDGWLEGAELDVQMLPTGSDRIGFNALYTVGKLKDTPPITASNNVTGALHDIDRPNLPKWTLSGNYNHIFQLGNAGTLDAGVSGHYEGAARLRLIDPAGQRPGDYKEAYSKWDADLTYNTADSRWSVQAFIKNIADKAVVGVGASGQVAAGVFYKPSTNPADSRYASLEAPRTYGLRVSTKF